ncbi:hypothetical protein [Nocardioides lianchengensis]|uniref:Lipoprotein n=1 Tax=Nocardioides lianchengensis TaxID=1045774 RepID=A0A1G6IHI0_9ACTN|nr:hypothetical protein [Nocardioides lianchengensis]NYG13054.1 hypothetical protein [Nocardioides lianchengensis]SDC05475.1 hypothetical protein SAMN05421872_101172 [Nocardioides lianchengensis]
MRLTRSLPAALLVLTLPLAGCSDGDPGDDPSAADSSSAAPSEPSEPSDEPTDESSEEPTDEPVSGDAQPVETDQVAFEVPADWEVVDPDEFTGDKDGGAIEDDPAGGELTDRLGISGDQLLQMMGQADVIVLSGAGSVDGFIDNLNVLHYPGPLPTTPELQSQLAEQYANLGADDPQFSTAQTGAGEAVLVEYVLPLQGREVQGRAIAVQSGSDVVSITVSARDADLATRVAEQVVASLSAVG